MRFSARSAYTVTSLQQQQRRAEKKIDWNRNYKRFFMSFFSFIYLSFFQFSQVRGVRRFAQNVNDTIANANYNIYSFGGLFI